MSREAGSHAESTYRRSLTGEREREQPKLGLATTREIIRELDARAEVAQTVGETWPGATTVDDESGEFASRARMAVLAYDLLDLYDTEGMFKSTSEHEQMEQRVHEIHGPDTRPKGGDEDGVLER